MATPYEIRPKPIALSPTSKHSLFKNFQVTPRVVQKYRLVSERNNYEKISSKKKGEEETARSKKFEQLPLRKRSTYQKRISSDLNNSSINQSSQGNDKSRKIEVGFELRQKNGEHVQSDRINLFVANLHSRSTQLQCQKSINQQSEDKQKKKDRKHQASNCLGIPYRKCHSSMQEKVVSVINKIKNGKEFHKELDTLIQKTKKISTKQLNNKYFVSGLQLIINLTLLKEHQSLFKIELVQKLSEVFQELKNKIISELDNTKGFEAIGEDLIQQIAYEKIELVRRAYKVLKKKLPRQDRQVIQNKAIQAAEWFIDKKINNLCLFYQQLAEC